MLDYDPPKCDVPGIDESGKFVVKNMLVHKATDTDLTFYNNPKMYLGKLGEDATEWARVRLNPTGNVCPTCGKFDLRFDGVGQYD